MKKVFVTAALAMFAVVNAQTFGLKGGLNVSSISNAEDTKAKVGFGGGLFMNAPIAPAFSIQPELLYNMKGVKGDGVDITLDLDYISVPVMFQYNATPQFYLEAGPEFSFLVNAKGKSQGISVDVKDNINSFDAGIGLGLGYYFVPNFGLSARYVAGLTEVLKDNPDSKTSANNVFTVGLAYKFGK